MIFLPANQSFSFGNVFLYISSYAFAHYDFDYLLRMDDDYFLCMKEFLHELPHPVVPEFTWGHVHCDEKTTRLDEGLMMFSRDLLQKFLDQDPLKMKCHPLGDQMVSVWMNELNLTDILRNDVRLHHDPIFAKAPELQTHRNVCRQYMGIHGCRPTEIRSLWKRRGQYLKRNLTLLEHTDVCGKNFTWEAFNIFWRYKPKLCITDPQWNTSRLFKENSYPGRELIHKRTKEYSIKAAKTSTSQ